MVNVLINLLVENVWQLVGACSLEDAQLTRHILNHLKLLQLLELLDLLLRAP